jgi:hypothetical protein
MAGMMPGKMVRICSEVPTFVQNNGVDSYKKEFRPDVSVQELLLDPVVSRSNAYYEETFGAGVTDDHVCEFIESWGVEQYKEWCARDQTYESIVSNARFALAQQKYLEKDLDPYPEPGFRSTAICLPPLYNPFHRGLKDDKGVAVPEPPLTTIHDDFYDPSYILYIQNNGVINYMLKINSINTLEHLLNYREVASWQRSYIEKLEYDDKLVK